jgi:hypothetical protein
VVLWGCILSIGVGCAFAALPNLIVIGGRPARDRRGDRVNMIRPQTSAPSLGGQVAASIVASHVLADGAPADKGFLRSVPGRRRRRVPGGAVRPAHPQRRPARRGGPRPALPAKV